MTPKSKMGFMQQRDQSCGNCNAFKPNRAANPSSGQPRPGWCVAAPPATMQVPMQTVQGPQLGIQGAWPTCDSDKWCRGWEPAEDEEKENDRAAS